jgi:hypothetical protein
MGNKVLFSGEKGGITLSQEYDLLRHALEHRTSCFGVYDDFNRNFCPHIIGWKNGEEQTLCWQFAGESSRPLPVGGQWKCFTISKFTQLATTNEPWHQGQPGKTGRPSSCVDQIDLEIPL